MKKIALITGASSGIGREFVSQIICNYPSLDELWLISRREEALLKLRRSFPEKKIRIFPLDLSQESSFKYLEVVLKEEKPLIRILVNSAGLGKDGKIASQKWQDGCAMIDVNCKALTAVTMLCLPYLRKGSRMIQVDSGAAFFPQPGFGIYAATKSYVLSFSQTLGMELRKRKITVTAVCPGPVDTEFFQNGEIVLSKFKKAFLAQPQKVVHKALKDAQNGKQISIYFPFPSLK